MEWNVSIQLDRSSREPLYVQFYKALKYMIENGQLKSNEKLPPIRKISEDLGVNTSTIVNAYRLLESNGYVFSRVGSGTYISAKIRNEIQNNSPLNFTKNSTATCLESSSGPIDFTNSTPDPSLFPSSDFKKLMDYVLDRDGGNAFGYTEVKGYKPLRECISQYINDSGINSDPDDIYISSGAQQGIDIITKVLVDYGDVIITERPTYTGAIAVFKSRGARIEDIPVNEDGMDISGLDNVLKDTRPKFIYLMTNFQNPTGFSYTEENMEKILYLAEKHNFYIIEDDYLSELYYSDKKPKTLKSMDRGERVIYIKSFSKTFMPGARLGFLMVPKKLQDRVLSVKYFSDISSSGFMQRVFELFIRNSLFDSYINQIRGEYKKRYEAITTYIERNIKAVTCFEPHGGVHLWIKLPQGLSSNMLYSDCISNGVLISPGSVFFVESTDSQYFRLNYASLNIDDIYKGINILGDVIQKMMDTDMYIRNLLVL